MASSRSERATSGTVPFARAAARLSRAANAVALAMLPPLMLLTTFDVLGRQLIGRPIAGVVEYSEFLLVVSVWFAVAETALGGGHIRMELFVDRAGSRPRALSALLGAGVGLLVALLVVKSMADLTVTSWQLDLRSDVAKFPLWIPQGAMAAGALVLGIQLLADAIVRIVQLSGRAPMEA